MTRSDIRLALPSKGRLELAAIDFLASAGLRVDKPNPRQYFARIPALPGLTVMFQRPGDIVVSVREGSVDFGIAGLDAVEERRGEDGEILVLHEALDFGHCALTSPSPRSGLSTQSSTSKLKSPTSPTLFVSRLNILTSRVTSSLITAFPPSASSPPKARSKSRPPSATRT